ncbi:MAG: FHA domain-containing protein, partial [Planctomycetota bacterium]|nr:FHA domain-containing protein [Planctomycetota bacterium]
MSNEQDSTDQQNNAAYIVVREGNSWRDVFRLIPGQVTTIGRAPTNRVVVRDEICSRNHCEVFLSGDVWTIRDRDSRNGTRVDGTAIEGDFPLTPGQIVQIGNSELGFTFDLSQPFPEFDTSNELDRDTETTTDFKIVEEAGEPSILHRKRMSRYQSSDRTAARDETSKVLGTLYRLAMEMAGARDSRKLCELILNALFMETEVDIGAVLLLPSKKINEAEPDELRLVAYKSKGDLPYQRVSDFLSRLVLTENEAVLAHDIAADDRLATR